MKIWSNKWFLFALIAAMVLSLGAFVACASGGDDDDDNDAADDDLFDDDAGDDDAGDDDAGDDDAGDDDATDDDAVDDDVVENAPVLSDGLFDPVPMELGTFSGYAEDMWYSALLWSVCDLDNDLMPDGRVYIYASGTTEWALDTDNPIPWDLFNNPPDIDLSQVGDCENPVQTGITVLFGTASAPPTAGDYCMDIEATDNNDSFSNKLTEICTTME